MQRIIAEDWETKTKYHMKKQASNLRGKKKKKKKKKKKSMNQLLRRKKRFKL